jgi:ribonuclease P protein component
MLETFSSPPVPAGILANAKMQLWPDSAMPPKKTARFPRTARLLRHADFERVYKEGQRIFSQSMTVFFLRREEQETATRAGVPAPHVLASHGLRVGFTVGRTLGGAVQRNRIKRRLREAVRVSLPGSSTAVDIVINPKKSILNADFPDILNEIRRAFTRIDRELQKGDSSRT